MTSSPKTALNVRTLVVGGLAGVSLILVVALIQHLRHGWPFSIHHDVSSAQHSSPDASLPDHSFMGSPAGGGQAGAKETRVPVTLDASKANAIGVRLERVRRDAITQPLRAVATVVPSESLVSHVHTRVAGWLEILHVNTTGQVVKAGEPVAAVFSQDLYATQKEYLAALQDDQAGPKSIVVEGAKSRLKLLGMTDAEIANIERHGEAHRLVTLTAPRSGVVLRRGVAAGTAVDPSTEILTVADLSSVWVWAEVPESGSAQVAQGALAQLEFPALDSNVIEARVEFIYPTLSERTRTLRVRFNIANPQGVLRPGLFGTAVFQSTSREALVISRDAVVDTGLSQHVFIATQAGRYEPRKVTLGARLPDRVEIMEGLSEGEEVVASGVFLLDSESRLRASGGAGTGHGGHGKASPAEPANAEETPAKPNDAAHGHNGQGG